jgi:hypothetical protein
LLGDSVFTASCWRRLSVRHCHFDLPKRACNQLQ